MLVHALRAVLAGLARLVCGISVFQKNVDVGEIGQAVYFANHASHFDFLAIWGALPEAQREVARPIAALDYWGKTALRRFLSQRVFNSILINRRGGTVDTDPLEESRRALRAGASLILFPEGSRSPDGEVQSFKSGIFHLAHDFPNVAFVPVYLDNLNRVLPKGEFLLVPLLTRVIFGPSIQLTAGEEKHTFLQRARGTLLELKP